jgi:DNA-binding NarL/FixJ family response regulator
VDERPLQVAVVSRHQLTRAGLTTLLSAAPDRVEVHDVADRDGHLTGHDVAVYDLAGLVSHESNDDGGEDLTHLLATHVPVVALVPDARPDLGEGALSAGVSQLVTTDIKAPDLISAVERAAYGESDAQWHGAARRRAEIYTGLVDEHGLTTRELDILSLVAAGWSNQAIADRLYLSINSVKSYIRQAYKRIGATSRTRAVLWGLEHGLGRDEPPDSGPVNLG